MGLDFTSIKDHPGSALYFIFDGTERDKNKFSSLMQDVQRKTRKQCLLLDIKDKDSRKIINFYQLRGTHFVLLVGDNDQLHHVWSDGEHFDASKIAYTAERMG